MKLREGVFGLVAGLLHGCVGEGILVHEYHCRGLAPLRIRLESGRVHGDKEVAEVSRG